MADTRAHATPLLASSVMMMKSLPDHATATRPTYL
jgi:hypothetical protein